MLTIGRWAGESVCGRLLSSVCVAPVTSGSLESPINHARLNLDDASTPYTFLAAGHLYGAPDVDSVYPASTFLANIDRINNMGARFFVALGDLYREPAHIGSFRECIADVRFPVFNAAGNHDVMDRALYEEAFGRTYYSFVYGNEAFVVLDAELH